MLALNANNVRGLDEAKCLNLIAGVVRPSRVGNEAGIEAADYDDEKLDSLQDRPATQCFNDR